METIVTIVTALWVLASVTAITGLFILLFNNRKARYEKSKSSRKDGSLGLAGRCKNPRKNPSAVVEIEVEWDFGVMGHNKIIASAIVRQTKVESLPL